MAGITSAGIGSGLDIEGIISKLMAVERQPLSALASKEAKYQAQLTAFGTVSSGLSSFQTALSGLTTADKFQQLSSNSSDAAIFSASASTKAVPGSYSVNVTQLAQAQTIKTSGQTSMTSLLGAGTATTLNFQFGTINGGSYVKQGSTLPASVATSGIPAGSLVINGTNIATGAGTTSAKALAAAINLKTDTTGVTATAAATQTATLGAFADVSTGVGDTYTLSVGGVTLASLGDSSSLSATDLDNALAGAAGASLNGAGITFTGTAAGGDLAFRRADGANIDITQTLGGAAAGGFGSLTSGVTQTTMSSISLSSDTGVSVTGSAPASAGLTAGVGVYDNAGFTQDANVSSGTVTIDASNNTLQGIRDAINKAKIGVTASIVSDGSASPYHLVITSNKTGASSAMKVTVAGDATLENLLAFDPTSVSGQKMTQTSAARDTQLTVNGIAVSSSTNAVSEAIQGVTINAAKVGTATLTIARDTSSVTKAVEGFIKGYNELNNNIKSLTAYDEKTKTGAILLGDSTVRQIQTGVRKMLSSAIPELSGNSVKTLSDVGITFQKDGSLKLDSSKLQSALSKSVEDVTSLFASFGTATDSLVSVTGSTAATKAGNYAVSISTPASRGSITGNQVLNAGNTVIGANTSISVDLDGNTATVPLVEGTYSGTELATMIQAAINGVSTFSSAGSTVKAEIDGSGYLKITSNRWGSSSTVNVLSGNNISADALVGASPIKTTGVDVAGTIGGQPATGSGQILTASAGNADGLKLKIDENATGGTISFSQGYAYQLNSLIQSYVESTGLISGKTKGINNTINDIGKSRSSLETKLTAAEKRYRAQFTSLDTTIAKMNQTSTYLTQQLASIAKQSGS